MGCGPSAPTVGPSNSGNNKSKDITSGTFIYESVESIQLAFNYITQDAHYFPISSKMVPIVCIKETAFPILLHKITFQETGPSSDNDGVSISLPVVAGAFYGKGRVLSFPSISIFSEVSPSKPEDGEFLSNAISWVSHRGSPMTPVLVYNFPEGYEEETKYFLQNHGFFVECCSKKISSLSSFKAIFITSLFDVIPSSMTTILEYVKNGGGLVTTYYSPQDKEASLNFPINPLLSKFGLGYTFHAINTNIEEEDINDNQIVVDSSQFSVTQKCHFSEFLNKFESIITTNSDPNTVLLDDLVTLLRYHIIVIEEGIQDIIIRLFKLIWDYLSKTNVISSDNLFCPKPNHCILMALVQELIPRASPDCFCPFPGSEIFPGPVVLPSEFEAIQNKFVDNPISSTPACTSEEGITIDSATFEIIDETWISTGFYLPPGVLGIIELEDIHPELHVQVGCHNYSLDFKTGPWHRWPSIIQAYALDDVKTHVGTPFGGIIYIAASQTLLEKVRINITFKNFIRYPRCIRSNPNVWETTKDIQIPFGELETNHVIFTMPSNDLRALEPHFEEIFNFFDTVAEGLSSYMSYPLESMYRVVFDIELATDSPLCGYPIIFPLVDLHKLLDSISKPNHYLFSLTNLLALVSLKEDCFDSEVEYAICEMAASNAFSIVYNNFNPYRFSSSNQRSLFNAFWQIHTEVGKDILSKTLAKFQSPSYQPSGVPEDTWLEFVRDMCNIGKMDFTPNLETARPIPLNVSVSLHNLPTYQTVADLTALAISSKEETNESESYSNTTEENQN